MRDLIDMRKEVDKLLEDTKYTVLIQRTNRKIHCSCYNRKYHEGHAHCNKCLGTGYLFKFEKHKTFKQGSSGSILFTEIGQFTQNTRLFYFAHDVHPQVKDYIWEVTWKGSKPIKLQSLYRITSVSDKRGINGRIEYFTVSTELEALDKDFRNNYIGKAWRDI